MNITTGIRERVRNWMPLEDLLPDRLPAFVRSPAYFFGVISLSSLVLLILSGIILAAFGPQWWHDDAVGHFMNSLHFWCAELFFFSMTLHLWVAFCKGAWRHGRGLTWVSGMIIFLSAIGTAFTGYLSMTNFSAQWIAVEGKDALNSIGIGAFFNLLNFGQMYGFHVVLLPLLLVLLIGLHLLQVRIRGIVRPYAPTIGEERARQALWRGGRRTKSQAAPATPRPRPSDQVSYYRGLHMMPYDLIREGLIALVAVFVLVVAFAGFLSSPDEPPLTLQQYAQQNPVGFVTTAMAELSATSGIAQYGPPYNQGTGSVQYIGPVSLQQLAGVTIPIDTAHVYVLDPLAVAAQSDPQVTSALQTFTQASAQQQASWEDAYTTALGKATENAGHVVVPQGNYGPLPTMMDQLLTLGTSGALDGLLQYNGNFYQNDFTKPLLFLSEDALPTKAAQFNLLGSQWGVMNETGNYPGQAWLWLYTFWYQVPPYNTDAFAANADALVLLTMGILTAILVLVPFIPYLNRLPYYLGIHRLIWREYYHDVRDAQKVKEMSPGPATSQ
ncbi:MAG TPA: cytochrome b N-terminal domain-containing protein [Ktedonobacteraceae bacterium]|nr:cytochrome b N-terminal domain-containing protein [Ktedonobacteraceae bacterium]